ncbi:serine hydrolase [Bacillus sp. BHET2]|nr:serine hydrolase [Bacillus sp. BHET2]
MKRIPHNMKLGFYLYDTKSKKTIMINEDDWFPLASVTKWITSMVITILNRSVDRKDLFLAISEHSRTAYERLNKVFPDSHLNEILKGLDIECIISSYNRDVVNNNGTPKGLFRLMNILLSREALNPDGRGAIIEGMKQQADSDGFRFEGQWYHMTGGLDGVCNDVGFVEAADRKLIVIGLLHCEDDAVEWTDLEKVMNEIGELIRNTYSSAFK